MKDNAKHKNFEILGLVILGIAIAMIILSRPLSIPAVESRSFASHGSGSSPIGGKSSGNNVGNTNSDDKVIMINFDDSYKTQLRVWMDPGSLSHEKMKHAIDLLGKRVAPALREIEVDTK